MAASGQLKTGERFVTVWDGSNSRWYATTVGPVPQMRERIFARVRTRVLGLSYGKTARCQPFYVCSCRKWRVLTRGGPGPAQLRWTAHLARTHTAQPLEHGRHWRDWAVFDEAREGRVWQPL